MTSKQDKQHGTPELQGTGRYHPWYVLAAVETGNFVVYLDGFIVNLALPWMMREFEIPIATVKWVVVAYLLAMSVTLLSAGRISDMAGRGRPVALAGMILMTISSGLCYITTSFTALVLLRALQGVGGAMMICNVMAAITCVFPKEKRTVVMSINASVLASGQVVGLVFGGFLIGRFGWRSVFLLIAALSMMGAVLAFLVKGRQTRVKQMRKVSFDWVGSLLSILGIGTLFFAFERFGNASDNSLGLGLIPVGLMLMIAFVVMERRVPFPLLDLSLFRSRAFLFGSSAAGIYFIAATSCYFMIPFYLQVAMGHPPLKAGILMLPLALGLSGTTVITARLAREIGPFFLTTAGMCLVFCSMLCFSTLTAHSHYLHVVFGLVLLGAGGGLFQPPNNSAVLGSAATGNLSAANGYLSTTRTMGQVIGAALSAQLLGRGLDTTGSVADLGKTLGLSALTGQAAAYTHAQTTAFRVAAAVALAGILVSMLRFTKAQE